MVDILEAQIMPIPTNIPLIQMFDFVTFNDIHHPLG